MTFEAGPNDTGKTLLVNLYNVDGEPILGGGWQRIDPANPPGIWEPGCEGFPQTDIYVSTALLRGREGPDQGVFGTWKIEFGSVPRESVTCALGVTCVQAPSPSVARCFLLTCTGTGVQVVDMLDGGIGKATAPPTGACAPVNYDSPRCV